MTAKEARKFIGKLVDYKCERSRRYMADIWRGWVEDVRGREIYVGSDWHPLKTFEVIAVINEHPTI